MLDISVIILTYNEEIHVARCIENARRYASEIFVVDSYSTDRTCEIAESLGAKVYQHEWINHSKQFAWALKHLPIATEWVWRQDADEWLTDGLIAELKSVLADNPDGVNAYTAPCLRRFMGREIRHGILPLILLRLFKYQYGRIEDKMMDEHLYITEGRIGSLKNAFYDDNLNGLTWWTQKHNSYATREAVDLLLTEYGLNPEEGVSNTGAHSQAIRRKKLKYVRLPLFWRSFGFFCLRYFVRGGFLDGKEGFLWHFLQGFWYRTLADAKVYEMKKRFGFDDERIKEYLREKYISPPPCKLILTPALRPYGERRAYAA